MSNLGSHKIFLKSKFIIAADITETDTDISVDIEIDTNTAGLDHLHLIQQQMWESLFLPLMPLQLFDESLPLFVFCGDRSTVRPLLFVSRNGRHCLLE